MNTPHLGPNQKKILDILIAYPDSTALEIAQLVYDKAIDYNSAEFGSVSRSLRLLEKRNFVKRIHGRIRWRRTINRKPET